MKNMDEHLLFAICENVPDSICLIDTSWNIQSWNKGAEDLLGYTAGEIIGKSVATIIPEEIAQQEIDHCIGELNAKGKMSAYETVRRAKDGRVIPIELTAVALEEDGVVTHYAAIMRDTTQRKGMEHDLVESEASLRTIFNAARDAILVHDIETGRILEVNDKFYELYQYTSEEIPDLDVQAISSGTAGYTNAEALRLLKRAAGGEPQFFEWMAKSKTGRIIPVEVNLQRVVLQGKDRIMATVRDITERKKTEENLRLTQFSVDHASVCAYLIGRDARFLYVNEQTCRTLGYSREKMLSMTVSDLDPDFPPSVWDDHWNELKTKGSLRFETQHRRKNGTLVPIEISLNYVSFAGREYNVAFGVDISERKKVEQKLASISRRNELILESAGEGIFGMDSRGNHIFVNHAGRKILGYDTGELVGKHSHAIWHHTKPDGAPYPEDECRIYLTMRDGVSRRVDNEVFWKKDGTAVPVEYTTTPIREEADVVGTVVTFRDITARKRAQEALQRAYAGLEVKVRERTRELTSANEELRLEVAERRRAVELIRRSKELSDALNALDGVIHSSLNIDEILQRVVEEAAKSLKVDGSMIGVFEDGLFKVRYVHNMPEAFSNRLLTANELRAMQYAAEAKDAVAFNDAFNDERLNRQFVREIGIRSLLVAPIVIKDRSAGAMAFYGLANRIEFDEEHIDFARRLGASVSLALETARLYQALQTSEHRLSAILNGIPDMAWFKDTEGRFILVNDAFARSGGTTPDELIGKTDFDIWPPEPAEKYRADDQEVMRSGVQKRVEEPLTSAGGTSIWIETIKMPIQNEQGEVIGTVGIARDVTDRKRMEEEIRHMAQHDALTGLPNRRLFIDILHLELAQARRHESRVAILFLDLDRFKEINDTLGHEFGDMLLKQVAGRFKGTIRESDTVARIGGDEFNMVLSDFARTDYVSDIAQKVVNSLRDPVILEGHELHITTSVGISIYPDDSEEIQTLLRYADIAMYHAKENGRNTFRFYNPSINVRSIERMRLESWLRQTIIRGELSVHYQPQVDIRTKKIAYAEALVRWNHPERGLLEPKEFLPLAEETGFITSIDEWVLRTVCTQARSWKDVGFDSFCVTVNLSARQFQSPDLVMMVSSVLRETRLPPSCLDIEVTENTAMSNIEQTASQLRELTEMGVHISIDDFGTGYSSLNYLKKLPIECIKIDKSFVQDIATNPDDRAIISAVTSMARQMGIRTVAEGVETEEQLTFVREAGCDEMQGFLVGRPVAAEQFKELVEK